jgi:enoyl reductase-like protein
MIYWTISNAGGMDDVDLAQFIERMKVVKAATVGDGDAKAEAHTLDVPYQSREAYLTRLEADMYKDAMALDTTQIAAGQVTATQIEAAYEPLNEKADMFEYCVQEFVQGVLRVLGIEDSVTFVRSKMANRSEEINALLNASEYLSDEYITEKVLTILGDVDRIEEIQGQKEDADIDRFSDEEEMEDFEDEELEESESFEDEDFEEPEEDETAISEILKQLEELLGGM